MNQIEYTLVASLMQYPEMIPEVLTIAGPDKITDPTICKAYCTMIELFKDDKPIDCVTVFTAGGGKPGFIAGMYDAITTKRNINHYAEEIAKAAWSRDLSTKIDEIRANIGIYGPMVTVQGLSALVAEQTHQTKNNGDIKSVDIRVQKEIADKKKNGAGLETGLLLFDRNIYAFHSPGHIWAIGGFTSHGKTAFAIEKLCRVHENNMGAKSLVISIEMTEAEVYARMIARSTGLPTHAILSGNLIPKDEERVETARQLMLSRNIQIFDSVYELAEIEAVIRKAHLCGGVDLVVIDYMQNIIVQGAKSEYEQHDKCAKTLQRVAKSNKTNIMILSQFSNEFAKNVRDADCLEYKGGGTLAAVCDVGIVLYKSKNDKSLVMCDVRKHRHGPLGCQALQFTDNWTRLEEVSHSLNSY